MVAKRYTFSGHESFTCKTLWLKKGYDFIRSDYDFNAPDAVIHMGVGKNMVASIRYWMRAFGMTHKDAPTKIATYLFDNDEGRDPYMEDLGTLWLLHFLLVNTQEATLYNWIFVHLQQERKTFDRQNILNFVRRLLLDDNKQSVYNENTIKKDIGTFLQNYILPQNPKVLDDYSSLLIDLDLIRGIDGKTYAFNVEGKRQVPWQIFLYALMEMKGNDNTVGYDTLQDIGLIFCMNDMEVIDMCKRLESQRPDEIRYSDTAGIRQLQFIKNLTKEEILNGYYDKK